jgi:hypothetical protein
VDLLSALVARGLRRHLTEEEQAVFEAPDEQTARAILAEDPVAAGGFARPELRPYRVGFLRGRA